MLNKKQLKFLERAIELARIGITQNKVGPFSCVIVNLSIARIRRQKNCLIAKNY
jgi:tRNA(Arg) A34 adenosine deaminase TadA